MIKRVLEEKGAKALLVLPYVALVQEKVRWLRNIVAGLPKHDLPVIHDEARLWRRRADENTVRIVGFFGGGTVQATWADFDIGICTIEKVAMVHRNVRDARKLTDPAGERNAQHCYRRLLCSRPQDCGS